MHMHTHCICTNACTHTRTYMCTALTHACVQARVHAHTAHSCTDAYACMYTRQSCTHNAPHVCTHILMRTSTHRHTQTYTHLCAHTRAHTQRRWAECARRALPAWGAEKRGAGSRLQPGCRARERGGGVETRTFGDQGMSLARSGLFTFCLVFWETTGKKAPFSHFWRLI